MKYCGGQEWQNMFQMAAEGDGNGEKVKAGVWASWKQWDFAFMLITSKDYWSLSS